MIIKKKDDKFTSKIISILRYFSYVTTTLLILLLILFNNKLFFKNLSTDISAKVNHRLFGKDSSGVKNINDLLSFLNGAFKGMISRDSFPTINLEINQKKILNLYENKDARNIKKKFVPVILDFQFDNENFTLRGKARLKGDRELHRENFNTTSFRINLSKNDRLFGIEEFSIQKPLLRNYTWELLIAEIFKKQKLLTLKSEVVKFRVNGDVRGLYVVEEVPSKVTLERQKRKDGPIFGLDENYILNSEGLLDVYDLKYWKDKQIYNFAKENLYKNFNSISNGQKVFLSDFAIDDWAKYFALNDLFGSYHGTQLKSVRIYYNPVNGKFHPILFDAHKGTGYSNSSFENFILLDFLTKKKLNNCDFICTEKNFYLGFLKQNEFLKKYIYYLEIYSNNKFVNKVLNIYENKFEEIDNEFYSRFMPSDNISNKAFSLYLFKFSEIEKRKQLINYKLKVFKESNKIHYLDKFEEINKNNLIQTNDNIKVLRLKNFNLKASNWSFTEPTIIILKGKNKISGISKTETLKINGSVMFVQEEGELFLENVHILKGINHQIYNRNLSGAINIHEAYAEINNLTLENVAGEDAINLINSNFKIDKIQVDNAPSDAVDIDFSNGKINELYCQNITNDCLDTSNSTLEVNKIIASNVNDKTVSAGENSKVDIKIVKNYDSNIGLVSKDSSELYVNKYYLSDIKLPISAYIKKYEYELPKISVNEVISDEKILNALLGIGVVHKLPKNININFNKSCKIYEKIYSQKNYFN